MTSLHIAAGIAALYILYKAFWTFKYYFADKSDDKSESLNNIYGKETLFLLAICIFILWLGKALHF